jgi:hypothetical protein
MLLKDYENSGVKSAMVVISNWASSEYGRQLKIKYSGRPNIILLDAIYNQEELDFLRKNSMMYIHTH